MTVFQAIFVGYLLGAFATIFCVWLAGGSLQGDTKTPDDAATSLCNSDVARADPARDRDRSEGGSGRRASPRSGR